jgi:F-type H+-transporting ATPase subunit gamma
MAGSKELRKRISSTKNTQQTTKAMKMVSAAKLRRGQLAILANRPYARALNQLIRLMAAMMEGEENHPVFRVSNKKEGKRVLLVFVSSDRGLCGGFNANIIKAGTRWIAENKGIYSDVQTAFVGKKAVEFYRRRGFQDKFYTEFGAKATFLTAKKAAEFCVDHFVAGNCDEVKVIYNEFKNAISQKVVVEDFMPIEPAAVFGAAQDAEVNTDQYVVKPSPEALMEKLLVNHFATQFFRVLMESQASEHGARMAAMESATKNASEMIKKLTIQYNKNRQAGITKELLEIIAGSESQKEV